MSRKIYLTEEQFRSYIKYLINENMFYTPSKDDVEFLFWVNPEYTGLDFPIGILESCIENTNILPVLYVKYDGEEIPVRVWYDPEFLKKDVRISEEDLRDLKLFIENNINLLCLTAYGEIDTMEFLRRIKPLNKEYSVSTDIINEMAVLRGETSGLNTKLWLDTNKTYLNGGHGPRIKFKGTQSDNTRDFTTMTISDNPEVNGGYDKQIINNKELTQIKRFVKANKYNLLRLSNNEITFENGFVPNMVKVDKKGNLIQRNYKKQYLKTNIEPTYGFTIVKGLDNTYNYLNEDGNIVSNFWFDTLVPFKIYGDSLYGYGRINGYWYNVYPDGTIQYAGK